MSSRLRNCLPMFDATCLLYGGLNHVMFLFLLFFCLLFWLLLSVGVGLLQKGMSTHAICPVEWGEISTKQSVGKCKQTNF